MTNLETQAIKAAYPFGGNALLFEAEVIYGLAERGLVDVVSTETLDDSINYVLTPAGKDIRKSL